MIESFITQHTFVKSGGNRYKYIGSKDIDIDIDYIREHGFRIEYATVRSWHILNVIRKGWKALTTLSYSVNILTKE